MSGGAQHEQHAEIAVSAFFGGPNATSGMSTRGVNSPANRYVWERWLAADQPHSCSGDAPHLCVHQHRFINIIRTRSDDDETRTSAKLEQLEAKLSNGRVRHYTLFKPGRDEPVESPPSVPRVVNFPSRCVRRGWAFLGWEKLNTRFTKYILDFVRTNEYGVSKTINGTIKHFP